MSLDNMKTLTAIANRPLIAPLIEKIHFHAYDYQAKCSSREAFKEMSLSRWKDKRWYPSTPDGKWRRAMRIDITKDQIKRTLEYKYLAYRRLLTEHQQILGDGSFEKAIANALSKMCNLTTITFRRETEWDAVSRQVKAYRATHSTMTNQEIKHADLKPLSHDPIYWGEIPASSCGFQVPEDQPTGDDRYGSGPVVDRCF